MKYAGIVHNDYAAGEGVCVSVYTQGCPHHCKNCHNPETWDFDGGKPFSQSTMDEIIKAISANNIKRNFCILGGEPLCDENLFLTCLLVTEVRKHYPDIKIYVWTGYIYEDLRKRGSSKLDIIFSNINYLIDGPYIDELRDITLQMRGSSNQRIIGLKG